MGRATVPPRNPNVDFRDEVSYIVIAARNLTSTNSDFLMALIEFTGPTTRF